MGSTARHTFMEFFAGGGMARLGLGDDWQCVFANDFDAAKRNAYGANFGLGHHRGDDIHHLCLADMPDEPVDLVWASSPCQDLSLAGGRSGLKGARSGAFFGFWKLIEALTDDGRAPRIIAIENVAGLLTSNKGADFRRVVSLMAARGYLTSAMVINASAFTPQSRPRLFILGFRNTNGSAPFTPERPSANAYTPAALLLAVDALPVSARRSWRWLAPRPATRRNIAFSDITEWDQPFDTQRKTKKLLAAMSPRQREVVTRLEQSGDRHVGAAFRRIRVENGEKKARIEARFDGVCGCLRTPAGGSSRQIIIAIDKGRVRSRLMTPREAARAMGLPESYSLPDGSTAALKLIGDGVAPPVVNWLAETIFTPALSTERAAA